MDSSPDPRPDLHVDTPLAIVALRGLCPRCGRPTLFAGLLRIAPACRACWLDFAAFNLLGDGAAAFLILIIGALEAGIAAWLALTFDPPGYVYVLVLAPIGIVLVLGGLRFTKAALIASEYRREAGQAIARAPDEMP